MFGILSFTIHSCYVDKGSSRFGRTVAFIILPILISYLCALMEWHQWNAMWPNYAYKLHDEILLSHTDVVCNDINLQFYESCEIYSFWIRVPYCAPLKF